jgi:hypothetical protein
MGHLTTINTHQGPETRVSRMGVFRLKRAIQQRDAAIRQAQKAYGEEVQAIFDAEHRAAIRPALANAHPWPWLADLRVLARRLRHG